MNFPRTGLILFNDFLKSLVFSKTSKLIQTELLNSKIYYKISHVNLKNNKLRHYLLFN